jgi:lipoprotein-releasing system permease protein
MFYELFIALRYLLRSKSHKGFVSFFTIISIVCVFIGIMAIIIVLSVMTGFEHELKDKVIGMYAHVSVEGIGRSVLKDWETPAEILGDVPHVVSAAPFIRGPVMFGSLKRGRALYVLGLDITQEKEVTAITNYISEGSLDIRDDQIILGDQFAKSMGVRIGDEVQLTSMATVQTPSGPVPRQIDMEVTGFFHTGNYEYDANFGFVSLLAGQDLFQLGSTVHGLKIKIDDVDIAQQVKEDVQSRLGYNFYVSTWMDQNKHLFSAVQMEKKVMFIILMLITVVAALNIISTLVMVVLEKTKDIGILRSIGATRLSIGIIFSLQGMLIALVGVVLGIVGGVLISVNIDQLVKTVEKWTGMTFFPSDIYYLDKIPSVVVPADVALVALSAFGLCLFATIFPAIHAARTDPVQALRYE